MTETTGTDPAQQEPTDTPETEPQPEPQSGGESSPEQQSTPEPGTDAQGGPPEGFVEKERFAGAIRKINEQQDELKSLNSDLAEKNSTIEQLKSQLSEKGVEESVLVQQKDDALKTVTQEKQDLEDQVRQLQNFKRKVDMAIELDHPELVTNLDIVPDMESDEALERAMTDILGFAENMVQRREEQLLSGETTQTSDVENTDGVPQSDEEWKKKINSLPLGSPERQQAFDEWFEWQQAQNQ